MLAAWKIGALVLLAVLGGGVVRVLLQLRRTLRTAEAVLNASGPRVDRTFDEVKEAAARINRLGRSLEQDAAGLHAFADAAAGLGRTLRQAQGTPRLTPPGGAAGGAANAPALPAALPLRPGGGASAAGGRPPE